MKTSTRLILTLASLLAFAGAAQATNSSPVPVPESGTMMHFGIGMFVMAVYGKRRMNKDV